MPGSGNLIAALRTSTMILSSALLASLLLLLSLALQWLPMLGVAYILAILVASEGLGTRHIHLVASHSLGQEFLSLHCLTAGRHPVAQRIAMMLQLECATVLLSGTIVH